MKPVEKLCAKRPWSMIPAEVISILIAKLDNPSVSKLRLVCKTWSSTVDAVLEELKLVNYPGKHVI
jgi:DNA-binding helix-hairpin-helix protein with protein kinase domain